METQKMKFNQLTREFVEDFISKMNKEDKQKLKEFIEDNPKETSGALFTMVKSYIYNHYFRSPNLAKNKKDTFADVVFSLLEDNENDKN